MNVRIVNERLQVGHIRVDGISSSSVLLVGDTREVINASIFDTPPEAVVAGPLVPFAPESLPQ